MKYKNLNNNVTPETNIKRMCRIQEALQTSEKGNQTVNMKTYVI